MQNGTSSNEYRPYTAPPGPRHPRPVPPPSSEPSYVGPPQTADASTLPPWFYPQQQFHLSQTHYINQERASYALYHHQFTQGHLPPQPYSHPSWFDPQSGAYMPDLGIGSLHFDRGYPDDTWPRPPPGSGGAGGSSTTPHGDDDDEMGD